MPAQIPSVPSTTGAVYAEPSAERPLQPGTKVGDLFARNMTQPYVLQRLTGRTYWVSVRNYATVFYAGDNGVLLMDALEGAYDSVMRAIRDVTAKPLLAVVYPHYHADHIADIGKYLAAASEDGIRLRVIASARTAAKMEAAASRLPGRPKRSAGRGAASLSKASQSSITASNGPRTPTTTPPGCWPASASSTRPT